MYYVESVQVSLWNIHSRSDFPLLPFSSYILTTLHRNTVSKRILADLKPVVATE